MVRKRNTGHKTYQNAIGSSITFIGQAENEQLFKAINFDLHHEKKGDDIVAYFFEDDYDGEIYYLNKFYPALMDRLAAKSAIKINKKVKLYDVLPEFLPKFKETWEARFEFLMRSTVDDTTRDDEGSPSYYEPKQEIVRCFSPMATKVNGFCPPM